MSTKANPKLPTDMDADIDQFLADNHDYIEAKLAEARDQIARGEARPIEPLESFLRKARGTRS